MAREAPRTPFNAAEEADGMAAGPHIVSSSYDDLLKPRDAPQEMKACYSSSTYTGIII